MAITIGRLGYMGLGIETTPGTAVAPTTYIPFTDDSMRNHHEPIEVIGAKTSRIIQRDSVIGKKWSEGDLEMDLDAVASGYLWKLALGNELLATGTPNTHTFYTTLSGNTPKTATLVFGRDTDIEQYAFSAVDQVSLEISDELGKLTASFMGAFGTAGSSQTVTTISGTVFSFANYEVRFGTDLTVAASASATPVTDFSLTISNNVEVIHRSGSADVSTIRNKGISVTGAYTLFFENEADKNAYYALNKRALEIKFTGIANEDLKIRVPRFRLSEGEISTGIDDFFVIKCEFVAEDFVDPTTATRFIDVIMRNTKGTVY